ncbi:TVP38/TMEM64 family protein [Motiliproteus sp. MSK22-1]|uniref:TVP38/TMEM64 family protein n=1 Tax=Motiliproteus sp. MSK22-1 TaxID=1897630 RepID=UPI0009780D7A|nr:VTT domain-containing protein [Motiliproteus sp. MSK22-1]OMH25819.1 hypothetical protein BGP75_25195 [Motiliproteus sp. MSK22-1]
MKPLIKVFLIIAACFATTFLLIKVSGILTVEQIEGWLIQTRQLSPIYVGTLVAMLLFADLFIAVPTLTVIILSGYFLGHTYGAVSALSGVMLAGICGYTLSRYYGNAILGFLVKDEDKRNEAIMTFRKHGFMMILLSRAMPILPEVTACLSGMTRMSFRLFLLAWLVSSVPYILIATYAGSISSIENPKPAIYTAIGLSLLLWGAWFIYHRANNKAKLNLIAKE